MAIIPDAFTSPELKARISSMSLLTISKRFLLVLTFSSAAAFAQQGSLDLASATNAGVTNLVSPQNNVLSSGQPTEEQFRLLAQSGLKHVINLRPSSEQDWDEGALVRSLGMEYYNLPISGAVDFTSANARSLDQLLAGLNGEPVLVHCASGNRVGGLIAVSARDSKGLDVEEAIAEGRRWGLTAMANAVREKLTAN
jgi:uncharacterized protein (TIGR01244 family)